MTILLCIVLVVVIVGMYAPAFLPDCSRPLSEKQKRAVDVEARRRVDQWRQFFAGLGPKQ